MNPLFLLAPLGLVLLLNQKKQATADDHKNVPLTVATRALSMDPIDGSSQIVWLNDNGWTRTATALDRYYQDLITAADVLAVAADEWQKKLEG